MLKWQNSWGSGRKTDGRNTYYVESYVGDARLWERGMDTLWLMCLCVKLTRGGLEMADLGYQLDLGTLVRTFS